MLIHRRCRLRSATAVRDREIEGCDSMLAEVAFERHAAIHRFGCVISHIFNGSPSNCLCYGQEVRNLRAGSWCHCGVVNAWLVAPMPSYEKSVSQCGSGRAVMSNLEHFGDCSADVP